MKSKQGGSRPGAGRPATRGERKQTTSLRLSPTLLRYLAEQDDTAANVVEDAVRRTADFRAWSKACGVEFVEPKRGGDNRRGKR
jgi:hypothetical protein